MITKVLIKLLEAPVKPEHPMDFIRDNLGATMYERNQIEQLEQQVNDYKKEVTELKQQIDELKSKLSEAETGEEKLTNGNGASDATVVAEKVAETAASSSVTPAPTISGGAKIDDSSDDKISESEKAVAPASVTVDDVPVIEAATADEQSLVPTVCDNGETVNVESAPTSSNVRDDSELDSTKKKEDVTMDGGSSNESTSISVTDKDKSATDAIEKAEASVDTKMAATTATDNQK